MAKPIRKRFMTEVDEDFKRLLREIQTERLRKGKDKPFKVKSERRITKAMFRHPLSRDIAKDIINADLE